MFTKSPGTSRPATPRTWSIAMVMATSLFLRRLENVESDSAWHTHWLLTTTWLTGRSEIRARPWTWGGLAMALGGREPGARKPSASRPRGYASYTTVSQGWVGSTLTTLRPQGVT